MRHSEMSSSPPRLRLASDNNAHKMPQINTNQDKTRSVIMHLVHTSLESKQAIGVRHCLDWPQLSVLPHRRMRKTHS
jgi:hypothetical protein